MLAAIVRFAFRLYTTVAEWMHSKKAIPKLRTGKQLINKEMVRDMLQNRTYLDEVCHSDTQYSGTLSEGKKASHKREEWVPGKLRRVLREHVIYFNGARPHEGLAQQSPIPRILPIADCPVRCRAVPDAFPAQLLPRCRVAYVALWTRLLGLPFAAYTPMEMGFLAATCLYLRLRLIFGV